DGPSVTDDVSRPGSWMGVKPARFQVGVPNESGDFRRRFENRIGSKLGQIAVLPDGLNHAAHAPTGFINRDRNALALQVKRRRQSRDAGPDDGDGFHATLSVTA